jgi:hypothetical protein
LCRSCAGARSSRHRSCGGGLSEEDEQPHVFHHDNVGTMAHIANKNPKPAKDYIVCPARNTHNIIRNISDPKDGSGNSSNSSRVCTFVPIPPGAMVLHRMSWIDAYIEEMLAGHNTDSEVEELLADHSTSPDACCYCIAPFEGGDQQECTYCRGFGHWSCGRVVIGGRGRPPGWRCWRCPTPEESSDSEEEECQLRDHTNPDEGEEKEEHQPRQQVQKSATEVVEWDCQHPHDGDNER